MNRSVRGSERTRGWAAAGVGAVAVTGLVVAVWAATAGPTEPDAGSGSAALPSRTAPPSSAPATGPAATFALFPADADLPSDTTREVVVDPSGSWPLGTCEPTTAEAARVDFVSGTERGPDYARDLAVGWYADEGAATAAYDAVLARIQACATAVGAEATSAPADVGTTGVVVTVAQPTLEVETAVAIYAISRSGSVVALAVDHADFYVESVPAPEDATTTLEHAGRLVTEVCRSEPARC